MDQQFGTPFDQPKKKNTTTIIIIVVVLILCCCCVAVLALGYQFGDTILDAINQALQDYSSLLPQLAIA